VKLEGGKNTVLTIVVRVVVLIITLTARVTVKLDR
jgi:hypothetical protein